MPEDRPDGDKPSTKEKKLFSVLLTGEVKERVLAHSLRSGNSVASFIRTAIVEKLGRDDQK